MRKILSRVRKAVDEYHMIEAGDKIAVGVSGGKDSLCLLSAMATLKRFYPIPFELVAISLDMGFEGMNFAPVEEFCKSLDVPFIKVDTDIAEIVFSVREEDRPCSLCAKLRRGGLNDAAKAAGCNKVALGHHNEDVIETFYLSLFFEGRLNCFSPVTYLSRKDIFVIRPMIYVAEGDIKGYAARAELPIIKNKCPMDGKSRREDMKEFINQKQAEDKFFKKKMLNAIQTGLDNWKIVDPDRRRRYKKEDTDK